MLSAVLLVLLLIAWGIHWVKFHSTAVKWIDDPLLSQFYGAPPMAILTVGLGAILIGKDIIGMETAVVVSWALWVVEPFGVSGARSSCRTSCSRGAKQSLTLRSVGG